MDTEAPGDFRLGEAQDVIQPEYFSAERWLMVKHGLNGTDCLSCLQGFFRRRRDRILNLRSQTSGIVFAPPVRTAQIYG